MPACGHRGKRASRHPRSPKKLGSDPCCFGQWWPERADRMAVMEHGRPVEVASHDELVEQGNRYAGLWASWQAGLAAPA